MVTCGNRAAGGIATGITSRRAEHFGLSRLDSMGPWEDSQGDPGLVNLWEVLVSAAVSVTRRRREANLVAGAGGPLGRGMPAEKTVLLPEGRRCANCRIRSRSDDGAASYRLRSECTARRMCVAPCCLE